MTKTQLENALDLAQEALDDAALDYNALENPTIEATRAVNNAHKELARLLGEYNWRGYSWESAPRYYRLQGRYYVA